jgi:hypothetical protein
MFVSYASADKVAARGIADDLAHAGTPIWSDSAIRFGEDFVDAKERGLLGSDSYLLLVSPDYMNSEFCMYELGFALKQQRAAGATIIPVAIGDTDVRFLPSFVRKFDVIDGRGVPAARIAGQVLDRLRNPLVPTPRHKAAA